MTIEPEFYDSATQELLAAVVDSRSDRKDRMGTLNRIPSREELTPDETVGERACCARLTMHGSRRVIAPTARLS